MANDLPNAALPPVSMPPASAVRTRAALLLISLVAVALELTLMRGLALRFWSHFACMVISVALLGFSAAGSVLTLLRDGVLRRRRECLVGLALALVASIPITWWVTQIVPLNVAFLAWSTDQAKNVLAIELALFLPFALAGAFICIALMDSPERISGHYAANLLGSGAGGAIAVLAMHVFTTVELLLVLAAISCAAAALLIDWRSRAQQLVAAFTLAVTAIVAALMPWEPLFAPGKLLAQARTMQGVDEIFQTEGPLGRIDVLAGPNVHLAPGVSLGYTDPLPATAEILFDGDGASPVYDYHTLDDWKFTDFRTAAMPFHVQTTTDNRPPRVCIIGAGGGAEIGLALFHHADSVTALEMNQQLIDAMNGPLAKIGGRVYTEPRVRIINQEARGFFAAAPDTFDIIQLPPVDGFGASGSGLFATQESYLYTVESLHAMIDHLSSNGVLAVTRWALPPPRQEIRSFDLVVQALRAAGLDPATHIAMIRSLFTTTVIAFKAPIRDEDVAAVRAFCTDPAHGFDLCALPGLQPSETNRFHQVLDPAYFEGPRDILASPESRERYLASYPFDVSAPTDDRPYFFHTFRWQSFRSLDEKDGGSSRAFREIGYILLLATLVQTVILGVALVFLPMLPGLRSLHRARGKTVTLAYFFMLGFGFMLLEMGFVQKLVLYLAHPIYAAAVVIGAFLVFAGLGSAASARWKISPRVTVSLAASLIVLAAAGFLVALDPWLHLTQSWPMLARCLIATITIAPLAFAMGHLFPIGLKRAAQVHAALVPWGWAVNGFVSVLAAAAAPLFAMRFGFSNLVLLSLATYACAALLFQVMPAGVVTPPEQLEDAPARREIAHPVAP